MLFNSIDFAIFLPIVFGLFWALKSRGLAWQNGILLAASYFFYGWWDWRFLGLIAFSTVVDFAVGNGLSKTAKPTSRKLLLWISIAVNLGLLGYFKYANFFIENFAQAFSLLGTPMQADRLNIILPVGISFYTFQTMSYTIDVYRKALEPTRNFLAFSTYVAFFPQLVAGPIERATNLLPQFYSERTFDYSKAVDGMRQILWGLFKKVVIADNCAQFANEMFNNTAQHNGISLTIGAVFFAFQIYGDFSGYSDIAIGTARLFGFNLMQNFAFPYFSRDIAEFWRRWHISLSTWFRDYLYIPLGGSRGSKARVVRNVFIIFLVSGFWHGANWTFLVWGGLNALYFLPLLLSDKNRSHIGDIAAHSALPSLREAIQMLLTFGLTVLAWIFFRAESLSHAFQYIRSIPGSYFTKLNYYLTLEDLHRHFHLPILLMLLTAILIEWSGRHNKHALVSFGLSWHPLIRRSAYLAIAFGIFLFGGQQAEFIYFQF